MSSFCKIIIVVLLLSSRYCLCDIRDKLYSAKDIADMAWKAYVSKDYGKASELAQDCIRKYKNEARRELKTIQQMPDLEEAKGFEVLNSVVTSLFIQAEIARLQNQLNQSVKMYKATMRDYPYSYCWDSAGNWFKAEDICKSRIGDIKSGNIFGDYRSETLTIKAWEALDKKEYKMAGQFANRCILLYKNIALKQQKELKGFASGKSIPQYWALNDVGTCHIILGELYLVQGEVDKTKGNYKIVLKDYPYSQCWDLRGWYWKVAKLAKDRLFSIRTGIELFDSSSQTLTTMAWKSIDSRDYEKAEMFVKRCISLYEKDAIAQQNSLKKCPTGKLIPYYWALNDVGTCYFILGEIYLRKKKLKQAKEMYEKVISDFLFSQCWDPRGWYWKVAEICNKRLRSKSLRDL